MLERETDGAVEAEETEFKRKTEVKRGVREVPDLS